MKFQYLVMSKPPHKRLPRKAKKRITKLIAAGYPNKYSSAKVAIKAFDIWRERIRQAAIDASIAWPEFAPEPYPYGVPSIGSIGTLSKFSDYQNSVPKPEEK